jgi:Cof subfamily protein (haloacid dehalogenase superfamily)
MIFRLPVGLIALDIDGTITSHRHELPQAVIDYFNHLHTKGWQFIFITGRPFQWGYATLKYLKFPYLLAVQNGALILEMPKQRIMDRRYLTRKELPLIEKICRQEQIGYVVYGGLEHQDWCYFQPMHWTVDQLNYLQRRTAALGEKWQALPSFQDMPLSTFASLKCFAKEEQAFRLARLIEYDLKLHAPPNKDPFDPSYYVIQATHPEATKGLALKHARQLLPMNVPVIAAGDDLNDITMLQEADYKIVMATAPQEMLALADVVAPPSNEEGIIQGLEQVLKEKF